MSKLCSDIYIIIPFCDSVSVNENWNTPHAVLGEEDNDLLLDEKAMSSATAFWEKVKKIYKTKHEWKISRTKQLVVLLTYLRLLIAETSSPKIHILVVEPTSMANESGFNRGFLLNVGSLMIPANESTMLLFHDVDLLPSPQLWRENYIAKNTLEIDHIGQYFHRYKSMTNYFGGVLRISADTFQKCNGYPNTVFGWGYEDDSQLYRLRQCEMLPTRVFPNSEDDGRELIDLECLETYQEKKAHQELSQEKRCEIKWEVKKRDQVHDFWMIDGVWNVSYTICDQSIQVTKKVPVAYLLVDYVDNSAP